MAPTSDPPSRTSTPRSFTNQSATAEELLKSQTVGLVNLADFRKRRADVLEQKEKEAQDRSLGRFKPGRSGTATPDVDLSDGALTPQNDTAGEPPKKKKKKKKIAKGPLSFGEDEGETVPATTPASRASRDSAQQTPKPTSLQGALDPSTRRLTPNPNTAVPAPKVKTKASLQAEAVARDALRKEFIVLQEIVKNTEILVPFVFYDGTNIPGGTVKVKKGDHIWLFLERCRKVGAELGVSGTGTGGSSNATKSKDDSRRAWARVGVDDLMCVRGEVIVPHHYELYYFIANRIPDPTRADRLLFDYTNTDPSKSSLEEPPSLRVPGLEALEGSDHDPGYTKVVDRRWYEKNKHIYPASLWKDYEIGKEFEEKMAKSRRDGEGNAFFFS